MVERWRLASLLVLLTRLISCLSFLPLVPADIVLRTCEPIRVEICKGLGYNETSLPNSSMHESQQDAEVHINTFTPLIQYGCSSQLRFFLCSVYVPLCTEKVPENIGPCRPLCQAVKDRCNPVLQEFGFHWPTSLDCDKFREENNPTHMCMEGPGEMAHVTPAVIKPVSTTTPSTTTSTELSVVHNHSPDSDMFDREAIGKTAFRPFNDLPPNRLPFVPAIPGRNSITSPIAASPLCSMYRHSSEYFFVNLTSRCSHKCASDVLFSIENKNFAEIWLLIWSVVCVVVTAFALYSFLTHPSLYKYPEKIIVIMSFTYFMYSSGHLIRLIFGRESVSCHQDPQNNVSLLITEGPDNFNCTIVFVVVYFFSMSSALWWVNLTISWFLSSGLNWSPEAIEKKSSYFHLVAWLIPFLKTLAILIMRSVDADELTGSCFVGNHSKATLLAFVILPFAFYLLMGSFFFFARLYLLFLSQQTKNCTPMHLRTGSQCCSSFSMTQNSYCVQVNRPQSATSHSMMSSCCSCKDNHNIMDWKISCFTFFTIVPLLVVLTLHLYEYVERDSWYLNDSPDRPSLEFFTIKIFMDFVIGIQSGLWVWLLRFPVRPNDHKFARFHQTMYLQTKTSPLIPGSSLLVDRVASATPSSSEDYFPLPSPAKMFKQHSPQQEVLSKAGDRPRVFGGETTV